MQCALRQNSMPLYTKPQAASCWLLTHAKPADGSTPSSTPSSTGAGARSPSLQRPRWQHTKRQLGVRNQAPHSAVQYVNKRLSTVPVPNVSHWCASAHSPGGFCWFNINLARPQTAAPAASHQAASGLKDGAHLAAPVCYAVACGPPVSSCPMATAQLRLTG